MKLAGLFASMASRAPKTRSAHLVAGEAAEAAAEKFLVDKGFTTVARNHRCRFGEVDLIMRDGDVLVFVEVRLRASNDFGGARESIHVAKQRRIIAAAEHYLARLSHVPPCRFDAILMNKTDANSVEWIRGAFTA